MVSKDKKRIYISLNKKLIEELQKESDEKDITVSQLISKKLSNVIDQDEMFMMFMEQKRKELIGERIKKGLKKAKINN